MSRTILTVGFYALIVLLSLGAKHIEAPYVILGQLSTLVYFGALLFILPSTGVLENAAIRVKASN